MTGRHAHIERGRTGPFRVFCGVVLSGILGLALAPAAAEPRLAPPLSCDQSLVCVIQQYPDADPTEGAADFTGGPLSYDGHQGTDFRVPDLEALETAPPVLAPADGRVLRLRNDVPDGQFPDGQDCGNGLVIDHGDGLTTQLCHLAQGSISVRVGQEVAQGTPVGRIGMTGRTEFPHVHITVRRGDKVIDPFVEGLWEDALPYQPGGLLSAGFSAGVPDYDAVKAGTADVAQIRSDDPIVLWGQMFGARAGDAIQFRIFGPDGPIFDTDTDIDRTQAQSFRAAGRRAPPEGWPKGIYRGEVILTRAGTLLGRLTAEVRVD